MKESLDLSFKNMILRAMEYHFPGAKVYLFGSRARGTHHPGTDIDIAVDAGQRITYQELKRARITLDNLPMPFNTDLGDMNRIPPELKQTILEEGVLWAEPRRSTPLLFILSSIIKL